MNELESKALSRRIVEGLYLLVEIPMTLFDIVTIPIRDSIIPRFLKYKFPILSCREWPEYHSSPNSKIEYYKDSSSPKCSIANRYIHLGIVETICGHYHRGVCYKKVPQLNPRLKN